jgi:hypothetical protein
MSSDNAVIGIVGYFLLGVLALRRSLGVISAISLLALDTAIIRLIRKNPATPPGA